MANMIRRRSRLIPAAAVAALLTLTAAAAQTVTFRGEGVKYELDLPSERWRRRV